MPMAGTSPLSAILRAGLVLGLCVRVHDLAQGPVRPSPTPGAATSRWPATVALLAAAGGGVHTVRCSGTLIADRWILTAGHCFDSFPPALAFFGSEPFGPSGGRAVPLGVAHIHPDYHAKLSGERGAYADLALVELLAPAGVPAASLAERPPSPGERVRHVGYGMARAEDLRGRRRQAWAHVEAHVADLFESRGEGAAPWYGDSGGSAYVQEPSGTWALAGVISFSSATDARTAAVRCDRHRAWIREVLETSALVGP